MDKGGDSGKDDKPCKFGIDLYTSLHILTTQIKTIVTYFYPNMQDKFCQQSTNLCCHTHNYVTCERIMLHVCNMQIKLCCVSS